MPSNSLHAAALFKFFYKLAPRDGFEPPTNGLTVRRSTTELPGNSEEARIVGKPRVEVKESRVSDNGVRHVRRFQSGDFRGVEMQIQGGHGIDEMLGFRCTDDGGCNEGLLRYPS